MAFTAETLFEDMTPTHQRSWDNAGYLAPAAVEVKKGTVMEFAGTTSLLLEVADTNGAPVIAGLLGQTVRNLDGGPISGIRDLVTTDRDYGDTVSLIRGSNVTVIRMAAQNGTDYQCGWSGTIVHGTTLYPMHHAAACDGGITDNVIDGQPNSYYKAKGEKNLKMVLRGSKGGRPKLYGI